MNIIITGASKGIGAEVAKILCKNKNNQVVLISRSAEGLKRVVAECRKGTSDARVFPLEFDLSQFEFYPFLLQKVEMIFRHCEILINNAGKLVNRPFENISIQEFDEVYNVNIKSPFFLVQALLPVIAKNSHVVNISSLGGVQTTKKYKGLSAYSSSKGALTVLTECLAEELKEREIRVNCLALGSVQTEMFEHAFPGAKALQSPPQIAQFIADFAVTGHRYFNGKVLPVGTGVP